MAKIKKVPEKSEVEIPENENETNSMVDEIVNPPKNKRFEENARKLGDEYLQNSNVPRGTSTPEPEPVQAPDYTGSRNYYEQLNTVYNELDIEQAVNNRKSRSGSIFDTNKSVSEQEVDRAEPTPTQPPPMPNQHQTPIPKEQTTLADIVDPKTGVIVVDNVMSTVSSTIYNFFVKDHKSSPQDWALSQAQMNGLYPVTKRLMEHIVIEGDNPYLAFVGVLAAMYGSKVGEVKSHYRNGTKIRQEADTNKVKDTKTSGGSKAYVKKWIGPAREKNPNPDHEYWRRNTAEFTQLKENYNLNSN